MDLDSLYIKRAERIIFRSGVKWMEHGEQNTKYFYSLEKARYNGKTCRKIINQEGQELTDDSSILEEQELFYRDLYAQEEGIKFSITNTYGVTITDADKDRLDIPLTTFEIKQALDGMKQNKTPGNDGLTTEFYQKFWTDLHVLFTDMATFCYENLHLPKSTLTGILNLIPKPGKDSRYLKNLRPITLLNVDYKIIEKTIARRLESILDGIINRDQTGFMSNRRISANVRKVFDLIKHCYNQDIPAIILNLDYMKCFDRISYDCIMGCLDFFGLPTYITRWIQILYTNYQVRVQNNGKFSGFINVERSVHQGGCASVQIFLMCAEMIALELRQTENIKGIPVKDFIYLLNQYADDTNISSEYSEESVRTILKKLEWFRGNTGFTLNYDKTEILRIGSLKNSEARLYTQQNVTWTNKGIDVLGIKIMHSEDESAFVNFQPLVRKADSVLRSWSARGLSLLGKISVINTLVASTLIYRMQVLPSIPDPIINALNNLFVQFIWNGKRPKIKFSVLQMAKKAGGLNLVNLQERDDAMKIAWIPYLTKDSKCENLVYNFFPENIRHEIWQCNFKVHDVKYIIRREDNAFWHDVLCAWARKNYKEDCGDYIWFNSHIRSDGAPLWWPSCFQKGLRTISQLYQNGVLKNFKAVRTTRTHDSPYQHSAISHSNGTKKPL